MSDVRCLTDDEPSFEGAVVEHPFSCFGKERCAAMMICHVRKYIFFPCHMPPFSFFFLSTVFPILPKSADYLSTNYSLFPPFSYSPQVCSLSIEQLFSAFSITISLPASFLLLVLLPVLLRKKRKKIQKSKNQKSKLGPPPPRRPCKTTSPSCTSTTRSATSAPG